MSRFVARWKHRRVGPEPDRPRICDRPECDAEGLYRAPRARGQREFYWFCLEHVRAYNKTWNYFEGMSEDEILAYQHEDVTGHRPTWPFGVGAAMRGDFAPLAGADVFGLFRGARAEARPHTEHGPRPGPRDPRLDQALDIMNLAHPIERDEIKSRYKELVKRHHPDANGGDKKAEERLKLINQAYSYLMTDANL